MQSVINDLFDNVFVINMERSPDRLLYMSKHLGSKNIKWTRIEAIDGNNLTNYQIENEVGTSCQKFCSRGMIGCALSHKKIWQTVLNSNLENAIIMEDDIRILDDYEGILKNAMDQLPQDWDILLLGCGGLCNKGSKSNDVSDFIFSLFQDYKNTNKFESPNLFIPELPTGFYCYAVSKNGCKKLLETIDKVKYHIDYQVANNFETINIYAIHPKIVKLSNRKSTINELNFPKSFNCILDKIKDSNGVPYSWYMNLTFFQWFGIPFNIWSLVFIILGMGLKKYGQIRELIILIFLLELIHFDKSLLYNLVYVIIGYILSFIITLNK